MIRPGRSKADLVLVDTSVWIAYFRGGDREVESNLDELIDADLIAVTPPVRLELILGCRKSQRASLMKRIDALYSLGIHDSTWELAEGFAMQLRQRGVTLGVIDALIAAAVSEQGACLWTLDRDFDPLFKRKLVRPFQPN